jgi:hypothetical protein
VPELKTEPFWIAFHLSGEFLTAIALIANGLGILTNASWDRSTHLVSVGMLLYTACVGSIPRTG